MNFRLPHVSLKLEMTRSKEDFFIIGDAKWKNQLKLELSDLHVTFETVEVNKEVVDAHNAALAGGIQKALYPLIESSVSFNSIAQGLQKVTINQIYQGILPSTIICGFLDNRYYVRLL